MSTAGARYVRIHLPDSFDEIARLRARWTVPIDQPLVLISQVQRSGGHLLAWLFDGHPACFTHPHELKWGRPNKWDWPSFEVGAHAAADLFDLLDEGWQATNVQRGGFRRAKKAPGATTLAGNEPLYPFLFHTGLHRELFVQLLTQTPPATRRGVLNAYLTAMFNAWLDYSGLYAPGKTHVTAFIPRVVMTPGSLERYFEDYPDGHLISIIRHPASWFASASRHGYGSDPEAALQPWQVSAEAALRAAERAPDKVTIVLFDDLVHRTREVMTMLCGRLGMAYHDCLLTPTFNGMPMLSNSSYRSVAGVDPQATERHRTLLAPEQQATIERLAVPLYERAVAAHGIEVRC